MRDHDGAYSKKFDKVLEDQGIQVKPVGPHAPNLNAYIERWGQSLKQEALNHFIVFGKTHFDYIVAEYVAYYLECRPHQGLDNKLLPLPRGKPDDEDEAISVIRDSKPRKTSDTIPSKGCRTPRALRGSVTCENTSRKSVSDDATMTTSSMRTTFHASS